MKIFIVDGKAMWPGEFEQLIDDTIAEREAQAAAKVQAMEEVIKWIVDYTHRIDDKDIVWHRFEVEPEKAAVLFEVWKYASRYIKDEKSIQIGPYGGMYGSMVSSSAIVSIKREFINDLGSLLRLSLPDVISSYDEVCCRSNVIKDLNAQELELSNDMKL